MGQRHDGIVIKEKTSLASNHRQPLLASLAHWGDGNLDHKIRLPLSTWQKVERGGGSNKLLPALLARR